MGFGGILRAIVVLGALLGAGFAQAQDWPQRPVTVIVPFAAGGTTDIVGRIVGQALSERLGQPVVIENVGGAGGNLGAANAAKATPDGYTVFMATVAHTMAPGIYKKLAYNFEQDFVPVTIVATVPNILIVNPKVPANNVAELIAYIKANPGKVNSVPPASAAPSTCRRNCSARSPEPTSSTFPTGAVRP